MGYICELYRINDEIIDKIVDDPNWGFDFVFYNYAEVGGAFHIQNDTVFSTDKAWDIADYLISKFAKSKGEEINVLGYDPDKENPASDVLSVIKSPEVKRINELIKQIDTSTISEFYDRAETIRNYRYRSDLIEKVDDYVIYHINKIREAYSKAAAENDGIVVRIG
jgi:hypothetical protein